MRKPLRAHALAQMRDRRRIAEKLLEAHGLSLVHLPGNSGERKGRVPQARAGVPGD